MKIAFYCQQVLGVGHFHRSLEICRALADRHRVTMICGGAPLAVEEPLVDFFQLPGLVMDPRFSNLAPWDDGKSLDTVKTKRVKKLLDFLSDTAPDVFIVELYPFGRKAFRFELDPALAAIRKGEFGRCLVLCSLRDILVERHDREKFEERTITTLNSFFDGLLIHGDPQVVPLEATFSRTKDIIVPLAYTGYVSPRPHPADRERVRRQLGIGSKHRLVVASIGGGNVGAELLMAATRAFATLAGDHLRLRVFTGPYAPEIFMRTLAAEADKRTIVERFTSDFAKLVSAADLSVSMAGYNTTMNILAAGTPALLFPFRHNREQSMRLEVLLDMVPFTRLDEDELDPPRLADLLRLGLAQPRFASPVNLDGAETSVDVVERWAQQRNLP